jgi:hypothetical protein
VIIQVFSVNGFYPWSFLTQIFHNGYPSHNSVASMLAVSLYLGNPDRNQRLWNIGSTDRYTPYAGADGILLL